jgi:4'-phosphopantetheinyl transferase
MSWQLPPAQLALDVDEVHVWCVSLSAPPEQFAAVLALDERDRAARFAFERDRRAFVVVRGVLRILLGRYVRRDPEVLRFGQRPRGKLYLVAEPDFGLRFNVSHSGELGLLAFARDREVGIDVQLESSDRDLQALAEHSFTADEQAMLRGLPVRDQAGAFFASWVRKEALVKATGEGIVELGRDADPRWSIVDLPALAGHAAALVVDGPCRRLSCWRFH